MSKTTKEETIPKVLNEKQQKLFIKFYPLVKKIVNSMRAKLPTYADVDDLHSAGVTGLADAIQRLDPEKEDRYYGYVTTRIRGSIIDELRSLDYMSRSARNDAKHIDKIRGELEQKYGREVSNDELRRKMGLSQKQFDKILRRTQTYSFISLNDNANTDENSSIPSFSESIADENAPLPYRHIETQETAAKVRRNISSLPEKQRRVIEDYYFEHKKLGEIANEFGLTEARICQIHSQALNALKPRFAN